MKEEMKGERILYPCYFNANLMRSQGRRITRSRAVKDPSLADIERAVKRCGFVTGQNRKVIRLSGGNGKVALWSHGTR